MKLYEVPRGSLIRLPGETEILKFHHIDGMYSYVTKHPHVNNGDVVHLGASTEVEVLRSGKEEVDPRFPAAHYGNDLFQK